MNRTSLTNSVRRIPFVVALTAAIAVTGGCGDDTLPKSQILGNLRVLALQADNPEVAPGGSVTITALVSDFTRGSQVGGTLPLGYSLEACVDPGVGLGATPTCVGNASRVVVGSGTFNLSAPTYTGTHVLPAITVPASAVVYAGRSAQDQFNGVSYLVTYTVTGGTDSVTAFRRVVVSSRTPKNSNPTISSVQIDNANISALPSVPKRLYPVLGATNAESYSVQLSTGGLETRTETVTVSWYASNGTLNSARTDASSGNDWTPPGAGTSTIFLVPVVRDDRGGVGFLSTPVVGP